MVPNSGCRGRRLRQAATTAVLRPIAVATSPRRRLRRRSFQLTGPYCLFKLANYVAKDLLIASSQLLFVRFPRLSPLVPLTALLPLSSPLTLTARPTPANSLSSSSGPQNSIDALVANLVDGMPDNGPSPSVIVGALGLEAEKAGMGAMREELKAAEERKGRTESERKTVTMAAVGPTRVRSSRQLPSAFSLPFRSYS